MEHVSPDVDSPDSKQPRTRQMATPSPKPIPKKQVVQSVTNEFLMPNSKLRDRLDHFSLFHCALVPVNTKNNGRPSRAECVKQFYVEFLLGSTSPALSSLIRPC
jgi:hypothetical protein